MSAQRGYQFSKKMGRPIVEIKEMKNEESDIFPLIDSLSDHNQGY